jgi:bifunctional N-acetylglucosamine-1-phosphate-uridyltransferase/glucosamine-1-phosphate-acetyltransferase GlmU-like protein
MPNSYNIDDIQTPSLPSASVHWTAIIPAAGRGIRLGGTTPKLLYPLLGKPLIDWAVERLEPYCRDFIIILAPGMEPLVRPRLEALVPGRFQIVIQEEARGMGQAVSLCQPLIKTSHCIIMWVDQTALSDRTVAACLALAGRHAHANLIFPTVWRPKPYIQIVRDAEGRIQRIGQAREESISVHEGENDCGIFFFKCAALFEALPRAGQALVGPKTGEMNLLPVIPFLDQNPGDVVTLKIRDIPESLGVNTEAEARHLEDVLKKRETAS